MVVICRHAHTMQDGCGKLEFYCSKFSWRMDLDLLERCRSCIEYKHM